MSTLGAGRGAVAAEGQWCRRAAGAMRALSSRQAAQRTVMVYGMLSRSMLTNADTHSRICTQGV